MEAVETKRTWSSGFVLSVIAVFVVGIMAGLAIYTFIYAKGYSYLSSDPDVCINCHVMQPEYDSWMAGPHHAFATCSDCHLPHDNIVHKYWVKGENGFMHAMKFTTGWYPENIEARQVSLNITNEACLYCHADLTDDMRHIAQGAGDNDVFDCIRCHSGVGHD